jgi:hypothetical protein
MPLFVLGRSPHLAAPVGFGIWVRATGLAPRTFCTFPRELCHLSDVATKTAGVLAPLQLRAPSGRLSAR